MRRATLLLTLISAPVVLAAGMALAAVLTCPTGPGDECRFTLENRQLTLSTDPDEGIARIGLRIVRLDTKGADEITGTQGADAIYAFAGNDSVQGNLGDDFIKGASGADTMYGGNGNDKSGGSTGNDIFYGGAGNDRVSGGEGEDEIHGGLGDDIDLDGDARIDKIYGEDGNDLELDGDAGNDVLYGGAGNDGGPPTSENIQRHGLRGEGDENLVHGNEGADTINAQWAADRGGAPERIFGDEGDDTIAAADGVKDVIDCGSDPDGLDQDTVVSHDDQGLDVLVDCERVQ
jgi:hemolysin type calcium-binding protein